MSKIQQRGICQCCGRQQAVMASGYMSKHGYTVQDGWFSGVCTGQNYAPMQHSIAQVEVICAMVQTQVDELRARADKMAKGEIHPDTVSTGRFVYSQEARRNVAETVAWADAKAYQQVEEVNRLVWGMQSRANAGSQWIRNMQDLAARTHGQPLVEVKMDAEAGPAPVKAGDKKELHGRTIVAQRVQGGNVFVQLREGFTTKFSTRKWRSFKDVA